MTYIWSHLWGVMLKGQSLEVSVEETSNYALFCGGKHCYGCNLSGSKRYNLLLSSGIKYKYVTAKMVYLSLSRNHEKTEETNLAILLFVCRL